MTETILFDRSGHIGRLTLNNPERHNSLGSEELLAIAHYVHEIERDEQLRVVIITGAGSDTFCAGASLKQLGAGEIDGNTFQTTTDLIAGLSIPTICAISGNVFGGGVELALSCDFRIGIENTRMRVPAAAIGLCYPLSGINRFVERLGVNTAKRLLVAAEVFSAQEMLEIGFLDHLVMPAQLEQRTEEMADNIASLAPLAVRAMKAILAQAASGQIDIADATSRSEACSVSEDLVEGLSAQREKRPPRFSGR